MASTSIMAFARNGAGNSTIGLMSLDSSSGL